MPSRITDDRPFAQGYWDTDTLLQLEGLEHGLSLPAVAAIGIMASKFAKPARRFTSQPLGGHPLVRRLRAVDAPRLPGMEVEVDDEGGYGRSYYSDDWQQARDEGREPTYCWHEPTHDVEKLAREVGEWNEMVAAVGGLIKDGGSGRLTLERPAGPYFISRRLGKNLKIGAGQAVFLGPKG